MERQCKKHGTHSEWRRLAGNKGWMCRKCRNEERHDKRLVANSARVADVLGESYVPLYVKAHYNGVPVTTFIRGELNRSISNKSDYHLTKASLIRIRILNAVSENRQDNTGWECSICGVTSDSPAFFDIDRIEPGSKFGRYTSKNTRILCPNCHRCVTHNIKIVGK